MKKINLNCEMKDLDGVPVPNANIGKIIANVLVQGAKGDPLKFFTWAMKLNSKETLELDPSDVNTLKEFVTNHETLTILLKAQTLNLIDSSAE